MQEFVVIAEIYHLQKSQKSLNNFSREVAKELTLQNK
jgi:hypothetical protein